MLGTCGRDHQLRDSAGVGQPGAGIARTVYVSLAGHPLRRRRFQQRRRLCGSGWLDTRNYQPPRAGWRLHSPFCDGVGTDEPALSGWASPHRCVPVPDLSKVSVLVGGKPANVLFAGMTYPGLFQINIQVPSGIPAGDQSIVLGVAGQTSLPAVYLTFGGG
jgi:hypothetical protein